MLQEKSVTPVGGNKAIPLDVRVIAATNRDLEEEIAEGRFRSDLFFRLNVIPIRIPPLRDRRDDIPVLVSHFIGKYNRERKRALEGRGPSFSRPCGATPGRGTSGSSRTSSSGSSY